MKRIVSGICALLIAVCWSPELFSAQSTEDVSASEKLKQEAREQFLGKNAENDAPQYIIGYGDILNISIYGEGDMAALGIQATPSSGGNIPVQGVQVRIDGRVSLKHIGDVSVVGLTLTEAADYLKILFANIYEDPVITVVLLQNNSKKYTVMGKVNVPGVFPLTTPLNLVQVIARSKGFTEWANSEVSVIREKPSGRDSELFKENVLEFDYGDFLKGKKMEKNIVIRSEDIIIAH